jgi:twitching motility protein PilT
MLDLDQILNYAGEKGASDTHITPGKPVYFRINGRINTVGDPISKPEIDELLIHILSPKQQTKLEEIRDVDFVHSSNQKFRFRCNAFHTREGVAMAFRMIPATIPGFETTGLPGFVLEHAKNLKKGLILVTGATGHGKSTSLASMIKARADHKAEHFILLEDPIEFLMNSDKSIIHQRNLERDVFSFERGLKAALREDPDVLMVGEMRDLETISSALTAAETGHVVFSTLHTNSAAETIHRIIDVFPSERQVQIRSQLASTLSMVVCQRLLESTDGGRVLVYEILMSNYAVSNHIRQNTVFQIPNAMQTDDSGKMVLFDQSLAHQTILGNIDYLVAKQNATSVEQLDYILQTSGFEVPVQ